MRRKVIKLSELEHNLGAEEIQEYEDWEELKNSLNKGYQPEQYGYIKVCKLWFWDRNIIYDGNHRVKVLKEIYGYNHEISVECVSGFSTIILTVLFLGCLPLLLMGLFKINNKNKMED